MDMAKKKRELVSIILPAFLGLVLFGLTIFAFILPWTENAISSKEKETIRELTDTVWGLLSFYHSQVRAGLMDLPQAQHQAKEAIRQLRYGSENKDYFWISDLHPKGIMHPYLPELEGRDLTQYVDQFGNHVFVDFADVARSQGAGFVEYSWQWKDDPQRTAPKVSYVRGFAPWGWVVGTGIYTLDAEAEMAGMTKSLTYVSLGILVLVSFLSGFLVLGSLRAARQRKEAHLALARQGEEYRAVFEAAPDPMVVYDNKGRATYLNPAFTRLFGWTWEEVIGRQIDFVPQKNREETRAAIEVLFQNNDAYVPLESKRKTKDGRVLDVLINAAIIRGLDENPRGMVVNLKDITEKKKAEQALVESERRYRELINNVTDVIYTHDLEGRILSINKSATLVFGYEPEEMIGHFFAEFMPPSNQRDFFEKYLPQMRTTGHSEGISIYLDKKGAEHHIEYRNVLIREGDRPHHVNGSGREVTDRVLAGRKVRRLEDNLRHAQKMEAVGTLAGGIAHDFNNILQIIGGYVQLVNESPTLRPQDQDSLLRIQGAVERASDLIQRLLTFSRKVEPGLKLIDLNYHIGQAAQIMERTLPKRITLRTDLRQGSGVISADPNQLEQVLLNLGNNARDAMPEGGELVIATREKELDQEFCGQNPGSRPGQYFELSVTDSGQGIDEESIKHIFDPFYTTKEIGQGTGLGLATVYGIVKNHKAYILCQSELGRGTTFRIFWPMARDGLTEGPSEKPVLPVYGGRETILLVDDEKDVLVIAREMLERKGYRVLEASSGEKALETYGWGDRGIDLVLMDLGMPGMGGHKALEELQKRDSSVKVVIASGYATDERVQTCLDAGAAAVVSKPYHLADMMRTIRSILDDSPGLDRLPADDAGN